MSTPITKELIMRMYESVLFMDVEAYGLPFNVQGEVVRPLYIHRDNETGEYAALALMDTPHYRPHYIPSSMNKRYVDASGSISRGDFEFLIYYDDSLENVCSSLLNRYHLTWDEDSSNRLNESFEEDADRIVNPEEAQAALSAAINGEHTVLLPYYKKDNDLRELIVIQPGMTVWGECMATIRLGHMIDKEGRSLGIESGYEDFYDHTPIHGLAGRDAGMLSLHLLEVMIDFGYKNFYSRYGHLYHRPASNERARMITRPLLP